MAVIRIPFPEDPDRRRKAFQKAAELLSRHGAYEGTPEAGSFHGATPIGQFAGTYRCPEGAGEMEITLTKKPIFVPAALVEAELRRFLNHHVIA